MKFKPKRSIWKSILSRIYENSWKVFYAILWGWLLPYKQGEAKKDCQEGNGMLRMENKLKESNTEAEQNQTEESLWEAVVKIQINDKDDVDSASVQPCHAVWLTRHQFSSVQLLSHVQLFVIPWTAARQTSLSITNSRNLPKLMSTESVMPSNHLILCHPLLLPPSIFSSIRVFSDEFSPSHQVTKVLEFQLQHQSFQWIFRADFL